MGITEKNLLLVDDEVNILNSLNRLFRKEKYNIFLAKSAREALDILEKTHIHVIVSDFKMPYMDGGDLLKEVKNRYPQIVRLMLSGFAHLEVIEELVAEKIVYKFISKPWVNNTLIAFVEDAFKIYDTEKEKI